VQSSIRLIVLRLCGGFVVALGVLHLAVTPHIAHLLRHGAAPGALDWLRPPMLLNHVVVGILLLPLGGLIFYAAPYAAAGDRWAIVVTRTIAVAMATLPLVLFVLMGTRYFAALPFLLATSIVSVASLALLIAAFWPPAVLPRG
jgi:hypothetical protein